MKLGDLKPPKGSRQPRKRVGRGAGSGLGKTSGRGEKGQKSRAGYSSRRGFEGGQMPLVRRIPKRGFTNIFRKEWAIVNVGDLAERFDSGATVDLCALQEAGAIKGVVAGLRVLGNGEIAKPIVVRAHHFSASAKKKLEAAGGRCEEIAQ